MDPGASGMSGRSPSASPAPGRSPSAAGGWATTRGVRQRPMLGVGMSPKTSRITKMIPCSRLLPPPRGTSAPPVRLGNPAAGPCRPPPTRGPRSSPHRHAEGAPARLRQ
eukprot:9473647-Alexandrium_andersonii.AAC.1